MADELGNPNNMQENSEQGQEVNVADLQRRIQELESDNGKLRQANTNASADASAWKKKYQDTLSESERAQALREEENAAIREERDALLKERNIANHTAALIGIGFGEDVAKETAPALSGLSDEDAVKVFNGIRKFIATHDKEMTEKAIMNNPTLPGGNTPNSATVTKEQFKSMSLSDRMQFFNEHPDLYAEYTKR